MNKDPISVLKREHANMRGVLTLIQGQLDILENGGVPDYVLLANAVYYMRKFPGQMHHPKEDLIFERLVKVAPDLKQAVEHARREHQQIYELEEWLIESALNAPKPSTLARGRLLDLGRNYLDVQRKHSEQEERLLFPRAEQMLTAADWDALARQSKEVDDPVFGRSPGERYELLYEHLMREASRV